MNIRKIKIRVPQFHFLFSLFAIGLIVILNLTVFDKVRIDYRLYYSLVLLLQITVSGRILSKNKTSTVTRLTLFSIFNILIIPIYHYFFIFFDFYDREVAHYLFLFQLPFVLVLLTLSLILNLKGVLKMDYFSILFTLITAITVIKYNYFVTSLVFWIVTYLGSICVYLLVRSKIIDYREVVKVIYIVVFSFLSLLVINFFADIYINGITQAFSNRGSLGGPLGSNGFIGLLVLVLGMFGIVFFDAKHKMYFIVVILFVALFTSSRTGIIVLILYYIISKKPKRKIKQSNILYFLIVLTIVIVFYRFGFFNNIVDRLYNTFDLDNISLNGILGLRADIIKVAFSIFRENLFGIGFRVDEFNIAKKFTYTYIQDLYEPNHSMTLFSFVYGGILYGCLFIYIHFVFLSKLIRTKYLNEFNICLSVIMFFIYGNVNGTAYVSFNNGINYSLYILLFLLAINQRKKSKIVIGGFEDE